MDITENDLRKGVLVNTDGALGAQLTSTANNQVIYTVHPLQIAFSCHA